MSLRVIAGKAKGTRLKQVPGDTTRPIMDRVKEALFNIIGVDVFDAVVLDLFAGTGSVGIEALSRGAAFALFCDLEPKAIDVIRQNLTLTRLGEAAEVRRTDAFALLAGPPPRMFTHLYIAPPQYLGLWERVLAVLDAGSPWVTAETEVIVQIDPTEYAPPMLSTLVLDDERRYGNTLLLFYRKRPLLPAAP
jgi:16S rRNA (guanine(966)-N(2))-methyltransferase RsmD